MSKNISIVVTIMTALLLIRPVLAEEVIKIGTLFSLTNYGAAGGLQELAGVKLAVEEQNKNGGVNGRTIELVTEDNQTDIAKTVAAFLRLKNAGVKAVLGPNWAEFLEVVAPVARQEKVVTLSASGWRENIFVPENFAFSSFDSHQNNIKPLADEIVNRSPKKAYAVISENSFCVEIFDHLVRTLSASGINFRRVERVNPSTVDYRSLIGKFNQEKPDLLYLGLIQDGSNQAFLKQYRDLKSLIPIVSALNLVFEEAVRNGPKVAEGVVYFNYLTPEQMKAPPIMTDALRQEIGAAPLPTAYMSFNLTKHLFQALQCSGGEGGERLRACLLTTLTDGIVGKLHFQNDGRNRFPSKIFRLFQVRDGRIDVEYDTVRRK